MKNDKKFFEEYKMDLIPLSADVVTTSTHWQSNEFDSGDDL